MGLYYIYQISYIERTVKQFKNDTEVCSLEKKKVATLSY